MRYKRRSIPFMSKHTKTCGSSFVQPDERRLDRTLFRFPPPPRIRLNQFADVILTENTLPNNADNVDHTRSVDNGYNHMRGKRCFIVVEKRTGGKGRKQLLAAHLRGYRKNVGIRRYHVLYTPRACIHRGM